jgi:hypothetical protein
LHLGQTHYLFLMILTCPCMIVDWINLNLGFTSI